MEKILSFPHLGNYHVPIEFLLKKLFEGVKIQKAPPITKRTLELGSRHSPDFVCIPFKYNLGNYIEALENGANVLIQAGGGCRYGYYFEVQEQILKDLGYDFEFVCILDTKPIALYRLCREIGCNLPPHKILYYILLTIKMVKVIDLVDCYVRENIGFETDKENRGFDTAYHKFMNELKSVGGFRMLNKIYKTYDMNLKGIGINKPQNCLKVGLVGELYTLMEPFSNFFIEKELAKYRISIKRYINVTYLLFEKSKLSKKTLKDAGEYLKYRIGADGTDSVADSRFFARMGYDGIIHIKPFGCTPEVNAMPMLQNIGQDYKIPILYFSFDSQTSETGIKTRLEAFYDMLVMRSDSEVKNLKTIKTEADNV
jgi:predicted nucleotide-binding protein (sugar kinase/HSP70/actin superfamily)